MWYNQCLLNVFPYISMCLFLQLNFGYQLNVDLNICCPNVLVGQLAVAISMGLVAWFCWSKVGFGKHLENFGFWCLRFVQSCRGANTTSTCWHCQGWLPTFVSAGKDTIFNEGFRVLLTCCHRFGLLHVQHANSVNIWSLDSLDVWRRLCILWYPFGIRSLLMLEIEVPFEICQAFVYLQRLLLECGTDLALPWARVPQLADWGCPIFRKFQ